MLVPFGEVGAWMYNTQLQLVGNVGGIQIVDGDGIEYYR